MILPALLQHDASFVAPAPVRTPTPTSVPNRAIPVAVPYPMARSASTTVHQSGPSFVPSVAVDTIVCPAALTTALAPVFNPLPVAPISARPLVHDLSTHTPVMAA